ncbi:SpoVR family protein [Clostridium sp.]|uniref:SpoVR family protein n=1 Tax=Clostridium sp. TaxID=1506 RepID=UPI0026276EE7|nr:SpoVR family protein [Clostridium sp.]
MSYSLKDLEYFNDLIEEKAKDFGLDFYEQEFEIIDFNEMLGYEAYIGMPSKYPHWSFGKAYDKNKTLYSANFVGLPYEMVINTNPCLAYLMRENSLSLQILIIAHVYGHNDFFKNNRLFKEGTKSKDALENFKLNGDIIRRYINDPLIGYEKVERILDAAHGIRFQIPRVIDINKIYKSNEIEEKSEDLVGFIIKYSKLEEWEKNILRIVKRETEYFIPQIETKIMNEGWASYWHYNILKTLNFEPNIHIEFLKKHNDVVAPLIGGLNPYYIGFKIFQDIEKRYGKEKLFEVRALERDSSFLRKYLTEDLCVELKLYQYVKKSFDYVVEEVSDKEGYKNIRNTLATTCGLYSMPIIRVLKVEKNGSLILEHLFDGRELDLDYAKETLKYINILWGKPIKLRTKNKDEKEVEIICDLNNQITVI